MKNKIRAMYFTGTGTTAKITTNVAYGIYSEMKDCGAEVTKEADINFSPKKAREKEYAFDEEDIVVFGVPVIAGRVPNVLLKFLDTLKGGGAMAVPVVLYGNRNFDDALIELRNILEDKGFYTVAAAAFIGEHSFSKTLAAGRPDFQDTKVANEFAKDVADKILWIMRDSEEYGVELYSTLEAMGPIDVEGCDPIRDYYKPRDRHGEHINILKVKPKLYEDKCIKCGMCAAVCPMGSISKEDPGVVNGICIKCCGCVKKCPVEALYYDDPGYIYHKEELEAMYGDDRKEPALFI